MDPIYRVSKEPFRSYLGEGLDAAEAVGSTEIT